ncbi:MAG: hypothetical protein GXP16_19460 [Gammaproteobacteria bacterium]|nr:hypothetical protein [Gammaproteobacteria bacterium]
MFKMLNQEYPPPEIELRSVLIALAFGLFIGSFLVFFQPFDLNVAEYENKNLKIFFFGVISTGVLLVFFVFLPHLFPGCFSVRVWKVKHQILFLLMALLAIATFNGLYINYLEKLSFSWSNYWWIIARTIILGGIPTSFLVLLAHNRKTRMYLREAQELHGYVPGKSSDGAADLAIFPISTESSNDAFVIDENVLLFVEAQGNYVFVYAAEEKAHKKTLHRVALTRLEQELHSDHLKRCHRSYLVNLRKVVNITGNAQGLRLWLEDTDHKIPVSRKYMPVIKSYFSDSGSAVRS